VATITSLHLHSTAAAAATKKTLILLSVLVLTLLAIVFTSCGGTEDETGGGGATAAPGDTTGVTDTSIKVGALLPLSGPAGFYGGGFQQGLEAYFDWVNDNGGIYGRKIQLIVQDSQSSGPAASEAARLLVDQQKVFALVGSMGDTVVKATQQLLDEQNVPDMLCSAGSQELVNPPQKNRFVNQVPYITEGKVFGAYLAENYAGKKVGILAQNDDFGKEGEVGIKEVLDSSGADIETTTEYYDVTMTDVTSQVQRLRGKNVDAIMFFGTALPAASMIKTVRETLSWDVPILTNYSAGAFKLAPLAGAQNEVGIVSTMIADVTDPTLIPFSVEWKKVWDKYQPDAPAQAWDTGSGGMIVAHTFVGLLKLAGPNLTRESLEAASESLCNWSPDPTMMPESTSPTDHALVESLIMTKAALDPNDPSKIVFTPFGDLVSFESTTECTPPKMPEGAKDQPGPDMGVYE
jgi:branched-chain amino acid transport system substrate-binding protein